MQLYAWQTECLDKWKKNKYRGIVNVVTGAGKTVMALAAVKELENAFGSEHLKVKIIVPKTFLVRQWFYALKDFLGVSRNDIGIFLGTHKGDTDRKFMIYVINSARYSFTRHMYDDVNNHVLIIADECHHYGTEENSKIFDFIRIVPNCNKFYTLGLSATPNSKNYSDVLVPCLGREIYRFTFVQALEAGIISRFSVLNIRIDFDKSERAEYDELSEKLSIAVFRLSQICPQIRMGNSRGFFVELEKITKTHKDFDARQLAQVILLLLYRRKEIVYLAKSRMQCVTRLALLIDKTSKIIVFGERIEMADEIYKCLNKLFPGKVGIYHSKLHESIRKTVLRNFEDSEIRILVSCKTLDEGLNVSDTDVGIIASSTSSERQRIQRLGRVLRKKEDGKQAYFYYLYVWDTMEQSEVFRDMTDKMANNINIVDLGYDDKTDNFYCSYYDELRQDAIEYARENFWDEEKIEELNRNIDLGIVSCDWLMDENDCIKKIKEATRKRERNYYVAMLFLIQASFRKKQFYV